jgi:UDP-glucose 4-epimerase
VALRHLRDGGESDIFNCGYSRGFSVLEVIEAVKRASGADFEVRLSERRPGDPAAIVASSDKIRVQLGWRPTLDNLDTIAVQALAWEAHLQQFKDAS